MNAKIGVSITTRFRPELLALGLGYFAEYTTVPMALIVSGDNERPEDVKKNTETVERLRKYLFIDPVYVNSPARLGVHRNKNKTLQYLKDCDYIFLFDDDVYPIRPDWHVPWIEAHKRLGVNHICYMEENFGNVTHVYNDAFGTKAYSRIFGQILFITQQVLKIVGGYDTDFASYGEGHLDYSARIFEAGLQNGYAGCISLECLPKYFMAADPASHKHGVHYQRYLMELSTMVECPKPNSPPGSNSVASTAEERIKGVDRGLEVYARNRVLPNKYRPFLAEDIDRAAWR